MTAIREWSIAVEGAIIAQLPESDRWGRIIEPAPEYRIDQDATNPEKQKVKLMLKVELKDGKKCDYYPNRTSARQISKILNTDLTSEAMKSWVGKTVFWGKIVEQNVMGQLKKVLYVTDVKLIA